MRGICVAAGWSVLGVLTGCVDPSLEVPRPSGASWSVELSPETDVAAASLAWRARVPAAPAGEPWLFDDELSAYYLRHVAAGQVPSALRERAVPLRFWREGSDCFVQPLAMLAPEASYTLAFTGQSAYQALRTGSQSTPGLTRVFPAAGRPKHQTSVECGGQAFDATEDLFLEPGHLPLTVDAELLRDVAPGCVVLSVSHLDVAAVAPPVAAGQTLDPALWHPSSPEPDAVSCDAEAPRYGACVVVADDRVFITPVSDDALWLLREPELKMVVAQRGARSELVRGLTPERPVTLRGTVLKSSGSREDFELFLAPRAPQRHVVLNEVLANPWGAEATGEWIEVLNDSPRPVSLTGLWLEDSGGHVPLPPEELLPAELALLVPPGFRAVPPDVAPAAGTRLLELPSLAARGLANSGEVLLLVGQEGIVSRFPGRAATHAGQSWARRSLEAGDDEPAAFAEHGAPGASPGAPNMFSDAAE